MSYHEWEPNCLSMLRIFYSLLVFGIACTSFVDDQPYCALRFRRLCQGKGRHVGCQYPYPGPGVQCQNYTQIKFTAKLRHFVINYINRRRQRIAAGTERARGGGLIPKPQVMMMVVWDRELALLAQRLADQCAFVHDHCRATVRYPYAGQTVGEVRWRGASGEADALSAQRAMRRVFDAWWGERRKVRPQQLITPFRLGTKSSAWGHFSQLAVWALAAAGCGAARHGGPRRLLLVCDFSHTNMLGQSTLTPGELAPCPPYSARRSRSPYPLLCAPVRVPNHEGKEEGDYGSYEDYPNKVTDYDSDATFSSVLTDAKVTHTSDWLKIEKSTDKGAGVHRTRSIAVKFKNSTKPYIIEKIDQELEAGTTPQHFDMKYLQKLTVPIYLDDLSETHDRELKLKGKFKLNREQSNDPSTEEITETLRRRWKHTRHRPRRPGANALLSKPVKKISLMSSSVVSLSLDREGMEQLFQDTGFHKHWKKESLP